MMLTVSFVNLLQVAVLTLAFFGIACLNSQPRFKAIQLFLGLVAISAIFNLLEELNITRPYYLVTPVFIAGFAPAIYLAVKAMTHGRLKSTEFLHFLPMLILLPFTDRPQAVIAIGTLLRIIYAGLSIRLIYQYQFITHTERSDADEISLRWFIYWLIGLTLLSAINLIRLNLQPYIPISTNVIGQGISTAVGLFFIGYLIIQLVEQKASFNHVQGAILNSELNANSEQDSAAEYKELYLLIKREVEAHQLYLTPRLTLNQLSDLCGVNSRDISRAINLQSGCNFNDFINQYRIDFAKHQLTKNPNANLMELALTAGFNSKSTFNAVFKRFNQQTPIQFKQNIEKNKN